jgi:uroporphyrinogen-III synthase
MTGEDVRTIQAKAVSRALEESGRTQEEFAAALTEHGARTDRSDLYRMRTGLLRVSEARLAALVEVTGHDLTWFNELHNGDRPS